ncbi:hypothetical protein SUGI_0552630 [Cryptomeria japonica]|nr:hypothetical protein SUGI_0552630 [Cryptomeria japonica]
MQQNLDSNLLRVLWLGGTKKPGYLLHWDRDSNVSFSAGWTEKYGCLVQRDLESNLGVCKGCVEQKIERLTTTRIRFKPWRASGRVEKYVNLICKLSITGA